MSTNHPAKEQEKCTTTPTLVWPLVFFILLATSIWYLTNDKINRHVDTAVAATTDAPSADSLQLQNSK